MTQDEYIKLYERVFSGTANPDELQQFNSYLDGFELKDLPWNTQEMGDQEQTYDAIHQSLEKRLATKNRTKQSFFILKWTAAAVAFLGICFSVYLLKSPHSHFKFESKNTITTLKSKILPGGNKAILKLADGSTIVLDSAKNGTLAQQGNTIIGKTADGQITCNNKNNSAAGLNLNMLNTISTPRGGQYQITLPDGTQVWLNAASSLKFPVAFKGNERSVELEGEAYFEVAKNAQVPFKVIVNHMEVNVLGTHFNIMAYPDEHEMVTMLLEGAVKLKNGKNEVLLKPGQQAIADRNTSLLKVEQGNEEETMAWKKGYFLFNNENIQSIMRKVSRWYDVDISYKGNIENKDFNGSISRFKNVTEVLKMLELTGAIHFNIEEGRITVMP